MTMIISIWVFTGGSMLQIDDSGSGSFVGGTCIGVYRPETNEYYFDIIPVELYNRENFGSKIPLTKSLKSFMPPSGPSDLQRVR